MAKDIIIPKSLPRCGIYRTTKAFSSAIPEGRLVYFHNHSQQGVPLLVMPDTNTHNRWSFQEKGSLVKDPLFPGTLASLLPEGLYILRAEVRVDKSSFPERALVQLGYNTAGGPILFMGRFEGNAIHFPDRGLKIEESVFRDLDPAGFVVSGAPKAKE